MLKKGRLLNEVHGDGFTIYKNTEVLIVHEQESNLWDGELFYIILDQKSEESISVAKTYVEVF